MLLVFGQQAAEFFRIIDKRAEQFVRGDPFAEARREIDRAPPTACSDRGVLELTETRADAPLHGLVIPEDPHPAGGRNVVPPGKADMALVGAQDLIEAVQALR